MENNIYNMPPASNSNLTNMEPGRPKSKIKKFILKPWVISIISLLLISGAIYAGVNFFGNGNEQNLEIKTAKEVVVEKIDFTAGNKDIINTVGAVQAETKIEVVALGQGTAQAIFFDIGDEVYSNKILADLYNSAAVTSHTNAQINYFNFQNSLEATIRATNEIIYQAELGVNNAQEAIRAAEISLRAAQDNLANAEELQIKSKLDLKDSTIISFYGYLNTINSTLEQINYIIHAEEGIQLEGIATTLSVQSAQSLINAKTNYLLASNNYKKVNALKPNQNTIINDIEKIILNLALTKQAVDDTIIVLNNTISSSSFSQTTLNSQLTSFTTYRTNIVNTQAGAKVSLQSLENIDLYNKQEIEALENAVKISSSQLQMAEIGMSNAQAALNSAIQAQDQQIIMTQTSLDSSEGQFNLSSNQLNDLIIKAPIAGVITAKLIELGAEVNPGQKIAEISQIDNLKIEINLPSKDIYRIKIGQEVIINNDLKAVINSINPIADSITKKVRAEILFNNKNNDLIAGTFVDVSIPLDGVQQTSKDSIFIPLKAVTIGQNEKYVFINDNGLAKKAVIYMKNRLLIC